MVTAPIAPGLYRNVPVLEVREVALDTPLQLGGPTVLAFDGDREHRISGLSATAEVRRDGPRVVDVSVALHYGASAGAFRGGNRRSGDAPLVEPGDLRYTGDGT